MSLMETPLIFDPRVKALCVAMIVERGVSAAEVARRLGIPQATLIRWLWGDDNLRNWPEGAKRRPLNVISLFPDDNEFR